MVDSRFVRLAHRWGLEVHSWTVDQRAEMIRLLDVGVDGLVTDRPDTLRELLRGRGQFPESPGATEEVRGLPEKDPARSDPS